MSRAGGEDGVELPPVTLRQAEFVNGRLVIVDEQLISREDFVAGRAALRPQHTEEKTS